MNFGLSDECVQKDADMKSYTTFKIGGKADYLLLPKTTQELLDAIEACKSKSIPYLVAGNGSNLLVRDGGIRGAVICTKGLSRIEQAGDGVLYCETGALLPKAAKLALDLGLSGLEGGAQIPATIGGAVFMNAGAFGFCMADVVENVTAFDGKKVLEFTNAECEFSYRKSVFFRSRNFVILGASLRLKSDEKALIAERMAAAKRGRLLGQPTGVSSAGSVFKGLKAGAAGLLIEKCSLKGLSSGAATVSNKHANFIINTGGATAKNVLDLIELIKEKLFDFCGEIPELEIQIVGED